MQAFFGSSKRFVEWALDTNPNETGTGVLPEVDRLPSQTRIDNELWGMASPRRVTFTDLSK